MAERWPRGQALRLYTNPPFRDVTNAYFDPTTVTVRVTDPAGTTTDYTLAAGQVHKDTSRGYTLGDFYYDLNTSTLTDAQLGRWVFAWIGSGATGSPADKAVFYIEDETT